MDFSLSGIERFISHPPTCWGHGQVPEETYFQAAVHRLSTRTHFTDPGLFHQAALWVVIGNSCGDASSAALGALGPCRCLNDAFLAMQRVVKDSRFGAKD